MTIKATISSVFLVTILLGANWVERVKVRQAESEIRELRAAVAPSEQASAVAEPDDAVARESKRELARLRNEVRQLRAQRQDVAQMRAANERLQEKHNTLSQPRPAPTEELGFVLNHHWANAGLGSPEATIQSFFWAAQQQDYQSLLGCLTPDTVKAMRLIDKKTQAVRPEALESLLMLGRVPGYRITAIEPTAENHVKGKVQCAVNGTEIPFSLHLLEQQWRIDLR